MHPGLSNAICRRQSISQPACGLLRPGPGHGQGSWQARGSLPFLSGSFQAQLARALCKQHLLRPRGAVQVLYMLVHFLLQNS